MTLAEIEVVCADDRAGEVWNDADLLAYAEWWRGLSAEEKLWAAQADE